MSSNFEELYGQIVGPAAQATVYAKEEYAVKLYRDKALGKAIASAAWGVPSHEATGSARG